MRAALILSASLVALSHSSWAATPKRADPADQAYIAKPCSGDDRMLCVNYRPDKTLQLPATPGATVRIALPPGEEVTGVLVSDQSILINESTDDQGGNAQVADASGGIVGGGAPAQSASPVRAICDANLCRSVNGHDVYLKPNRDLAPQPLFIQTRYCDAGDCQDIVYPFELVTRPADTSAGTLKAIFGVRFLRPDRAAEAQRKAAEARFKRRAEHAAEMRAMAPPPPSVPTPVDNRKYAFRGPTALAPDDTWDDGSTTFMRFSQNRRIPVPYTYLPDGSPTKINYAAEPGPGGTILRIAGIRSKFCLADGISGCVYNVPAWMAEHGSVPPSEVQSVASASKPTP